MSYISEMRERIGHDPLLSVALAGVIESHDGKVLLQKRSDTHDFGTPGGNIEFSETVIEGFLREIKEETGLQLLPNELQLFGIYSGKKAIMTYPNSDVVNYVVIVFYVRLNNEVTLVNQESEGEFLKFYSPDNLPDDIKEPDVRWIKKWVNRDFKVSID